MTTPCTVCHVATTKGDMTTLSLVMPKSQICFARHEKSAAFRDHTPPVKGSCIQCHDAHSSERLMLLREAVTLPLAPDAESTNSHPSSLISVSKVFTGAALPPDAQRVKFS